VLVELDPASGEAIDHRLRADTHQHGVTLSPDRSTLYVVGTGPAGGVTGAPRLTAVDLATMAETHIPLSRPHEKLAISADGRYAYLGGGFSFANGGWDGLTIVDLAERTTSELPVPAQPLDVILLPAAEIASPPAGE
jgi:hypothetical protein